MKKIIKKILPLVIVLSIFSCDKFLEEEPKNQISVNQFFSDPNSVRSVVNSLYGLGVVNRYVSGDFQINIMLGGYLSGLFENERTERIGPFEANNLTLNAENLDEYLFNYWRSAYEAISQANVAIKYIPIVEGLSTAEANNLMAQARFFRAFNYFALVKDFGDVPLITEPYESLDNINVPRDPSETVYAQIIEDLEWALDNGNLADVLFVDNGYRVTDGVVAATLANVQLQRAGFPVQGGSEAYSKAADAARRIINSGTYALIPNGATAEESAFRKMRVSEMEPEYIFSVEMDGTNRSNPLPFMSIPKSAGVPGVIGDVWIVYRPLDEFLSVYEPDQDLRGQNRQIWYTSVEKDGVTYSFSGLWAPYKWYDEVALFETARSEKDVEINTYAEVLLIAAEAIAQTEGVTMEAVQYLSEIRSRGYWQTDRTLIETELLGLSKDQFVQEVWKERLRELPLISKVWSDIQRTRLYPSTTLSNPGQVDFVDVVGHTNPFGATYQEKHLLLPIARRVRERNPELTTNGY